MKHTRLIPIIIIAIMLFNCVLPVLTANAASTLSIQLNRNLYNAVKEELELKKINANYNDQQRKITISQDEISKVTTLDLSNSEISDLTGLDVFSNLTQLDLSSNELTKESNLNVLSSLNLSKLDLSTNNIEDVSSITNLDLISELNLHSQNFTQINVITEENFNSTLELNKLPQILSEAGTLRPEWVNTKEDYEDNHMALGFNFDEFYSTNSIGITAGSYDANGKLILNTGLLKLNIKITDTTNVLSDSDINLYYLVINSKERAAIFKDVNLYNVVKKQLTKETNDFNEDLRTYLQNGDTLYKRIYDEPMIMVFDLNTLINEIPSLIVSNSQIEDLSGIEAFVGLKENLDISYNYIDSIDKIIELEENKQIEEAKLQERFKKQIEKLNKVFSKIIESLNKIDEIDTKIKAAEEAIANLENYIQDLEAKAADATGEEKTRYEQEAEAKKKELNGYTKEDGTYVIGLKVQKEREINGYTNEKGEHVKGLIELREEEVIKADAELPYLHEELNTLYEIYNNNYKATSLLTTDLSSMTEEDFNKLDQAGLHEILKALNDKIAKLESSRGLSETEKVILKNYISEAITIQEQDENGNEIKNAISTAIDNELKKEETEGPYKAIINAIIKADTVIQCINYFILDPEFVEYNDEKLEAKLLEIIDDKEDLQVCNPYIEIYNQLIYIKENNEEINRDDYGEDFLGTVEYLKAVLEKLGETFEYSCVFLYVSITSNIEEITSIEDTDFSDLIAVCQKFVSLTEAEIQEFITLTDLKQINMTNNLIESLEGIDTLTKLKELYAGENEISDLTNVNWNNMIRLKVLDMHHNFISNIKSLEVLNTLEYLDVSNNLLSGKFDFNTQGMVNLAEANFSENQYHDISNLIEQYEWKAKTLEISVGEYLNRQDTINVKFYNQNLKINVGKFIIEDEESKVETIKLPAIFKQLETLDYSRTIFGTESIYGKVRNDGTVGLEVVNEEGKHTGKVTVLTKDDADKLSMGHGTTCTITYEVAKATVNDVENTVENNVTEVELGKTIQFNATVNAENVEDTSVVWTIERFDDEGNVVTAESTTDIDENGLLTIDPNETATKIVVTARSNFDNSKFATAEVKVVKLNTTVAITTTATETGLEQGSSKTYATTVTTEAEDKTVTWTVTGNTSENTKFENNVLTIGEDEEVGTKLTITATSNYDNTKTATIEETVIEKIEQVTVEITPAADEKGLEQGSSKTYIATVKKADGTDAKDTTVQWTVTGNTSENTKFENNVLTIGEDEVVGTELTITATSNYDNTKAATVKETVISNKVAVGKPTQDNVVFEQTPGTTVSEFISELVDSTHTVELVDENGNKVAETARLATGMKVKVDNKTEYTIVVTGDVNKDGNVDSLDSNMIKAYRLGSESLTDDIQKQAADINSDGTVNRIDSFIILLYRAGSTEVTDFTEDTIKNIMK